MEKTMLKHLVFGAALAVACCAAVAAEAQVYFETKIQGRTFGTPGVAARERHDSPLNPLDAPDAGAVWKPSNRDAGDLAAARWSDYAARHATDTVAARPAKPAPWERYPHYDSLGALFSSASR
jgi:hypothetical protein